jgi:hypothetical protein
MKRAFVLRLPRSAGSIRTQESAPREALTLPTRNPEHSQIIPNSASFKLQQNTVTPSIQTNNTIPRNCGLPHSKLVAY